MAEYVVTDIDKWLARNKRDVFELIQKQGRRIEGMDKARFAQIKNCWNDAENAVKTNDKLDKWNKLQEELSPIFKTAADNVEKFDAKISKWNEDPNFQGLTGESKAKYDFWAKLNDVGLNRPDSDKEKLSNLEPANAFEDKYDYDQMKYLAGQYGYNYDVKEERAEFVDKVAKLAQNKELEKIWNEDVYAGLVTPVTKEYARKNYQNIDGIEDLAAPLAADVGINTLMAGTPGGVATNLGAGSTLARAIDNTVAPLARGAANLGLNTDEINKDNLVDAGKTVTSEIATNYATPWMLRGIGRRADKYATRELQKAEQQLTSNNPKARVKATQKVVQDNLNKTADRVRDIEDKLKSGYVVRGKDGSYFRFDKNGNKSAVTDNNDLITGAVVNADDFDYYLNNKFVLRDKNWGPEGKMPTGDYLKSLKKAFESLEKKLPEKQAATVNESKNIIVKGTKRNAAADMSMKMNDNIKNGKPVLDGISAEDMALVTDRKPKESFWNWADSKKEKLKDSVISRDMGAYLTNLQGRSKWGSTAVNSLLQAIPAISDKVDLTVKERPDVKNDPELQMLKRLYDLHKKNSKLVAKPKVPKKWEQDYTIEEIFGY